MGLWIPVRLNEICGPYIFNLPEGHGRHSSCPLPRSKRAPTGHGRNTAQRSIRRGVLPLPHPHDDADALKHDAHQQGKWPSRRDEGQGRQEGVHVRHGTGGGIVGGAVYLVRVKSRGIAAVGETGEGAQVRDSGDGRGGDDADLVQRRHGGCLWLFRLGVA